MKWMHAYGHAVRDCGFKLFWGADAKKQAPVLGRGRAEAVTGREEAGQHVYACIIAIHFAETSLLDPYDGRNIDAVSL